MKSLVKYQFGVGSWILSIILALLGLGIAGLLPCFITVLLLNIFRNAKMLNIIALTVEWKWEQSNLCILSELSL